MEGVVKRKLSILTHASAGSALLVVLIMLGVIAILAVIASRSVSGASREMMAARSVLLSQVDLHAGIELGVAAIFKLGGNMRTADVSTQLINRRISVHITNERARIDLNTAPKEMLAALFVASGVDQNESDTLAAAVEDWRGGSASQKLVAAEHDDSTFRSLPGLNTFGSSTQEGGTSKQVIGTRYFVHPVQLASVPGFSKQLVRFVLPFVTVANGSSLIDPYIASQKVLESLPGATSASVQAFLTVRNNNTSRKTAITMLGVDKKLLTDKAAIGWRLDITSVSRVGRAHHREVVVVVSKGGEKPFYVLYASPDEII